jgi:hypothetical protein
MLDLTEYRISENIANDRRLEQKERENRQTPRSKSACIQLLSTKMDFSDR